MDLFISILIAISCGAVTSYIQGYLNRRTFEMIIDSQVKRLEKRINDHKAYLDKNSDQIEMVEKTIEDKDEYIAHLVERVTLLEEEKWEFINTKEPVKDKKDKHGSR